MSAVGFRPSGLTPDTFKNIQTGAGAIYFNVDMTNVRIDTTWAEIQEILKAAYEANKMLGATRGGCTFNAVPDMRQMEIDDLQFDIPGTTQINRWEVTLGSTALEIKKDNILMMLPTSFQDPVTGAFRVSSVLTPEHYQKNVVWAGLKGDGGYQVIELTTVLNLEGMAQTMANQGEGTIPVNFRAHQANLADMQFGPFNIWLFDNEDATASALTGNATGIQTFDAASKKVKAK